jgi:hypothetical protein
MNRALVVLAVGIVISIAGCSSPTKATPLAPAVSATSMTSSTPSTTPTPTSSAEAELRAAVQAYSDAYLSGDAAKAYALLSERCKKMDTFASFSYGVSQAKIVYGNPLPIRTYKAHIAEGMARVTYTYDASGINQTNQPWTLEATGWHDDNC